MAAGYHAVRIGAVECTVISDGTFPGTPAPYTSPKQFLFPAASSDQLAQALQEHHIELETVNDWIIPFAGLLIRTGDRVVLMDTGAGGLGPDTGELPANLKAAGVELEDIDIIIHSHAHRDHVGGNTDSRGNPAFPNASYFMWKDEWDYWNADATRRSFQGSGREAALELTLKNLAPLRGRVQLIEGEGEIIPGVSAVEAPGHTPGHMALAVSSRGQDLLCLADTVHHVIHMEHPEWATAIDYDRDLVTATRRKLLGRAARDKTLVFSTHMPFPGLGHVVPRGDAWQWLSIDAQT